MKFTKGDKVEVNVNKIKVSGEILSVKKKGIYQVQYENGETYDLNEKYIKLLSSERKISPPPSPGRKARINRKASPSRRTSASPSRRRSPARTKSPSRQRKTSPPPPKFIPPPSDRETRSSRIAQIIADTRDSPSRVLKVEVKKLDDLILSNTKSVSEPYSFPRRRKALEHDFSEPVSSTFSGYTPLDNGGDQSFTRLSDLNDSKILHLKADYEQGVVEPKTQTPYLKFESLKFTEKEFGGWFGALIFIIGLPLTVFGLNFICNEKSCSWKKIPDWKLLLKPETYYDFEATALVIAYATLITLLSVIPYVGKKASSSISRHGLRVHKMNGMFSLIITVILIAVLENYNISVIKIINKKFLQLCVTSMILGFILSIVMYIHSKYQPCSELNTYGVTGNFIYDFFMGRTTHPQIFGFDVKLLVFRSALVAVVSIYKIIITSETT